MVNKLVQDIKSKLNNLTVLSKKVTDIKETLNLKDEYLKKYVKELYSYLKSAVPDEKKILGKEYKKSSIILTIKDNILKNFSR